MMYDYPMKVAVKPRINHISRCSMVKARGDAY